jgi:hypothetical protein
VILEESQEIKANLLILNGGQRRDQTADAGLFSATHSLRANCLGRTNSGVSDGSDGTRTRGLLRDRQAF